MTDTIEVPIELIELGDIGAIRDLLPKPESLLGRWATHPDYGRVIILSESPDKDNFVQIASSGLYVRVGLNELTLDLVELVTEEDFENVPTGTIVTAPRVNAYQKVYPDWESMNDVLSNKEMADSGPWKILRVGWGQED